MPADVFKDPVVIEFVGLPESPKLVESELEEALVGNLQAFLLEMGKGFAFVSRQERLTPDADRFYSLQYAARRHRRCGRPPLPFGTEGLARLLFDQGAVKLDS